MVSGKKQSHQRKQRHDREELVIASEEAPSCAGVAPVHELKKAWNNHLLVIARKDIQNDSFGDLVQCDNQQRDERDAATWRTQDGTQEFHLPATGGHLRANPKKDNSFWLIRGVLSKKSSKSVDSSVLFASFTPLLIRIEMKTYLP